MVIGTLSPEEIGVALGNTSMFLLEHLKTTEDPLSFTDRLHQFQNSFIRQSKIGVKHMPMEKSLIVT